MLRTQHARTHAHIHTHTHARTHTKYSVQTVIYNTALHSKGDNAQTVSFYLLQDGCAHEVRTLLHAGSTNSQVTACGQFWSVTGVSGSFIQGHTYC